MIGVKLYDQFTLDDKMQEPIIECCIKLDIPILMHAGKACKMPLGKPLESNSSHFIAAARKYPEAVFIMGHIGGGGDWSWQLKGLNEYPNIFTDISGSVHDDMLIEETVKVMGSYWVLFGTDGSFSSSIGKLLDADISWDDKFPPTRALYSRNIRLELTSLIHRCAKRIPVLPLLICHHGKAEVVV